MGSRDALKYSDFKPPGTVGMPCRDCSRKVYVLPYQVHSVVRVRIIPYHAYLSGLAQINIHRPAHTILYITAYLSVLTRLKRTMVRYNHSFDRIKCNGVYHGKPQATRNED